MTTPQTSALDIEEIMSKPEGSKCIRDLAEKWTAEFYELPASDPRSLVEYVAEKAMDHQREQDALICNQIAYSGDSAGCNYSDGAKDCASAIRAKSQEGESNG